MASSSGVNLSLARPRLRPRLRYQLMCEVRWQSGLLVLVGLLWACFGLSQGSWLGEVPTAAQMFGEEAVESPHVVPFEDEENDEDEDADLAVAASTLGLHTAKINEVADKRHRKRDADDELLLKRRAARRKSTRSGRGSARDELEDGTEGEEDAWVHDGVDDIQIDPETRRAATDLSGDVSGEQSIDAEYEQQPRQVNRTRITTIAEVIPITTGGGSESGGGGGDEDEDDMKPEVVHESPRKVQQPTAAASTGARHSSSSSSEGGGGDDEGEGEGDMEKDNGLLPAAYLSLDQVVRLVSEQQARAAAAQGRPLAATTTLAGKDGRQVRLSVVDGATSGSGESDEPSV